MAEDRDLPGWPKKRLVRDVKRSLHGYGIVTGGRYVHVSRIWGQAWAWAADVARSYQRFDWALQKRYRERWPSASEIASQYILLLCAEMRESRFFKLPFRAKDFLPERLRPLFATQPAEPGSAALPHGR